MTVRCTHISITPKSVYTADKLEENSVFTLVYDVGGEYDFYADFENYTIDDSVLTYGGEVLN